MSKELECLDRIDKRNYLTEREHKEFLGVVEKAIKEYEAIKKSEPSEALVYIDAFIEENNNDIKNQDITGFDIDTQAKWVKYLEHKSFMLSTIKQALKRLEAIDNANPSEALKELNAIENNMLYLNDSSYDQDGIMNNINASINTIKQALLKAQEPKKYLKWEDLEKDRIYKVLLNGRQYELRKWYDDYEYHCDYITLQKNPNDSVFIYDWNKEIFNDLHLERVEE